MTDTDPTLVRALKRTVLTVAVNSVCTVLLSRFRHDGGPLTTVTVKLLGRAR